MATGTQTTLSVELNKLSPRMLAQLRAHLAHYWSFEGETRFDAAVLPKTFATRRGPLAYVGAINRENTPQTLAVVLGEIGLDPAAQYTAYDPERGTFARVGGSFDAALPAKSFGFRVVRQEPGVLWTPSSFTERALPDGVQVTVQGPTVVEGVAWLVTPPPAAVLLDGAPLAAAATGPGYQYDVGTGVLQVRYTHGAPRELTVRW
jgi:hypothetical protein